MYYEWKWSLGIPYYKSARKQTPSEDNTELSDRKPQAINNVLSEETFFNKDSELLNITDTMFSRNQYLGGSIREDLDSKLADREMVTQTGVNPFFKSNYVNDISDRDKYLKPINTTSETNTKREKS